MGQNQMTKDQTCTAWKYEKIDQNLQRYSLKPVQKSDFQDSAQLSKKDQNLLFWEMLNKVDFERFWGLSLSE